MSCESVCQVARSWVEVDCFHTCLFVVVYVTFGDFHDASGKKRVCIKFCAKLGKSATETLTMIKQDFGNQILSRMQVFEWHAPVQDRSQISRR
jgi:hypothetical protein